MPKVEGYTDEQIFEVATRLSKETNRVYIAEALEKLLAEAQSKVLESTLKPTVSGSFLLAKLLEEAEVQNEDGMESVKYIDKPNGGSVAYLRHDAVVKKLNQLLKSKKH